MMSLFTAEAVGTQGGREVESGMRGGDRPVNMNANPKPLRLAPQLVGATRLQGTLAGEQSLEPLAGGAPVFLLRRGCNGRTCFAGKGLAPQLVGATAEGAAAEGAADIL